MLLACSVYTSHLVCILPQNWYSPLLVACLAGERYKDAVEVLLEAGADPNGHNRVRLHVLMIT